MHLSELNMICVIIFT